MIDHNGFVGRDRELGIIAGLVDRGASGGGALLVHGDAGIGKSALLERAVEQARTAGMRVLRTTGVRTEANLPFAGLHQLLRPILAGLDALPKPQYKALAAAFGLSEGAAHDPFLIALATLTLLADAAADAPILVVADDVQWLDRPSADALAFVARRLGADPLVMVVGLRDGDPSPFQTAGIDELALEPLHEGAARQMVASLAHDLSPSVLERILREAAGNPLALAELSATIRDGAASPAGRRDSVPLSARLERAFAERVDDLPRDTQWLLLIAALDGRDAGSEILAAAGVAASAVRPAVAARLLEVDGPAYRFRHPLIRSAIQQRAATDDLRAAHRAIAGVLDDADRAAWHLAAASDPPDEAVAALLDAAAERAIQRGALTVAVAALQRGAALSANGRGRGTRLLRAASVAYELGRTDVIGQPLAEAGPIDVGALESRRQAWLMALALSGPRSPREKANLRSVIAAAKTAGEDGQPDLGLALLHLATSRSWWIDPGVEVRSEIAAAARALAPTPDDARLIHISALAPEDHIDELLAYFAEHSGSPAHVTGVEARRVGTAALWLGALDLAVDYLTASIAALRDEGRLGFLAGALTTRAYASAHLGLLKTVGSDLDEGLRLDVETRQPHFVATAEVTQAMYLAFRGDIDAAEARMAAGERVVLEAPAGTVLAEMRHARGIIDLAAGRHAEAYEQLRHLLEPSHESFHPLVSGWAASDFIDAAAATDHREQAAAVLDALESDSVRMKMPWWKIGVAYGRAALASAADDADAGSAFAAAQAMDLERWPLARARLHLAYGTWLRRQRRVTESRTELRLARDLLDAIGVRYLADRAQRELGASGEASRHHGIDILDELTPQELQIARLAAEGLSNREIGSRLYLSHRTVGSHLYRVFPKLGVTSRGQLHTALG